MKQALQKLKGCTIPTKIGQITLLQSFRQNNCEYDQLYFTTSLNNTIAKVYDLQNESSHDRFRHQQSNIEHCQYQELVEPLLIEEIQIKKDKFGLVILPLHQQHVLAHMHQTLSPYDWLLLTEMLLKFIQQLRTNKQVFLNINPWSIARNGEGQFKVIDAEFMTSEGSYCQLSQEQQELIDMCQKEYQYRPPELLDEYGKNTIDSSSDLFSTGTVLYQLLYHEYPFDSKLSQINANPKPVAPDAFMGKIISFLLQPYPKRPKIEVLLSLVESEKKKAPKEVNHSKNMSSGSTAQSKGGSNLFSALGEMFSRLTTQTESWYLNYAEDSNQCPDEKYLALMVSKLYKKESKLQKLQSVLVKYITQGGSQKQNQMLKTGLLIVQLFRRSSVMNFSWQEVIEKLDQTCSDNLRVKEICSWCRQKLSLHLEVKGIMRGNYLLEDLSKFKYVTFDKLELLIKHLGWLLQSVNSKFVFGQRQADSDLLDYARELYCDQILDVVSMVIMSMMCIRQDVERGFRKDSLNGLIPLQKRMDTMLKRISQLANHAGDHGIYALEGEFFRYQEELQLRQNPYQTSFQHFYKHAREHKGLVLPQNFQLTYFSTSHKDYHSNELDSPQQKQPSKHYFRSDDSDEDDIAPPKIEVVKSPTPGKIIFQSPIDTAKPINNKTLSPKKKQHMQAKAKETSKTVSFDQFFDMLPTQPAQNAVIKSTPCKVQTKPQLPKTSKQSDFAFFEAFSQPPKDLQVKSKPKSKPPPNFFQDFLAKKQSKAEKPAGLNSSNSQKLLQQNILSFDWLKNNALAPPPPKSLVDPALLKTILGGLKLRELKDAITNNQQVIIDFSKLKLDKVIGSGSAGEVYLGRYQDEILAIKKVKTKQNPNALKQFERELLTYIKIKRNPYLVSLVGLSKHQEDYYLLTQFCNAGSLFDLLHKKANTVALSWKQRLNLAIQIAKGMLALHEMNPPIIHRDLKSLNVFVLEEKGVFTAKVADFGLSRSPEAEMMTMYLGTLHWMAPQLLDNKQYSLKVDVYSFAILLWEICSRRTPYNQLSTPMAIIKHVTIEKKRPNMHSIPPDCPPGLISLCQQCWAQDPAQRPHFPQIIEALNTIHIL